MVLLSAVALVGSVVVAVLLSYCYWTFRDVNEAQEELHHRVLQFYRVALDVKGIEDNIETVKRCTTGDGRTGGSCRRSRTE